MGGRGLTAILAAGAAGLVVFGGLLAAGLILDQRLAGSPGVVLLGVALLFTAAGAYAGWLLGLLVYSALRGADEDVGGG